MFLLACTPALVYNQRCDGRVAFVLLDCIDDTSQSGDAFADGIELAYNEMISADGRYRIVARAIFPENASPDLLQVTNLLSGTRHTYLTVGCGGDVGLLIERRAAGVPTDTMSIVFLNACDAYFGINITYQAGAFEALVCDTTRIAVSKRISPSGVAFRSLDEQYPARLYGGYDITSSLRAKP